MSKTATAPVMVRQTISLPESTYDVYAERAAKRNRTRKPEDEMVDTLHTCRWYNATLPIYLDDTARQQLEQLAGRPFRTPDELVAWATHINSLKIAGTTIPLDERLLKRLETRCFGLSMPDMLRKTVVEALEEKVGLR